MTMIGSFNFNGLESDIFGLICKSVSRPLLPSVKVNRIELQGMSGASDFNSDEYDLRKVVLGIIYVGDDYFELRERAREISAWLSTGDWRRLILNDEPDKYYLAKITKEINLKSVWESGRADLEFECQPFAYSLDEKIVNATCNGSLNLQFDNEGTRKINYRSPFGSKFLMTLTGSWTNLSISLNGVTLTYNKPASSETLIIDNYELEVSQNGSNTFLNLGGDIDQFFEIIPGTNNLLVSGVGVNATVTITYIPLWI